MENNQNNLCLVNSLLAICAVTIVAYKCIHRNSPEIFTPERPTISQPLDKAAVEWAYKYHTQAIKEMKEYAGLLVYDNGSHSIKHCATKVGEKDSVKIVHKKEYEEKNPHHIVCAHIHSHAEENIEFNNEKFSNSYGIRGDISVYRSEGVLGYVCTPRGRLLRYNGLDRKIADNVRDLNSNNKLFNPGIRFDNLTVEVCGIHSIPYDTRYVGISGNIRRAFDNILWFINHRCCKKNNNNK